MINTRKITFAYPSVTFDFPDVTCQASHTLLITGASGTGKTTLLHLLAGLQKAQTGNINIDTTDITTLSGQKLDAFRGKNIGLILQQSYFIASLSVLENVMLASWLGQGTTNQSKAKELLERLGLENQLYKPTQQLSIGQQQRVSIARALINNPKVILADEPTSSLDDQNALVVADLLHQVAHDCNAALIIVTHDSRLKNRFNHKIELFSKTQQS